MKITAIPYTRRVKVSHTAVMLVVSGVFLYGCTINIYHNVASNYPTGSHENSLVASTSAGFSINNAETENHIAGTVGAAEIMQLSTSPVAPLVASGDSFALQVILSVDAYVSCFYQQDGGNIIKLFPNRIIPIYLLKSGQVLRIPGANGFRVLTNSENSTDSYMCLASDEDVMPNLPLVFQSNAFQQVPVSNFEELFSVYDNATTENLIARVLEFPVARR